MKIIYVIEINIGPEITTNAWAPDFWEAKRAYTTRLAAEKHIEWCLKAYGDRIEYCIEELELYE
jgi:hypothetical protein